MLEVRYNTATKLATAWCGDETQFGNLDRGNPDEVVVILDIPIPEKHCLAYLYDEATQSLIPNPDYVEPGPEPWQIAIAELEAKMIVSEPGAGEVKITNLTYNPTTKEIHHRETP